MNLFTLHVQVTMLDFDFKYVFWFHLWYLQLAKSTKYLPRNPFSEEQKHVKDFHWFAADSRWHTFRIINFFRKV